VRTHAVLVIGLNELLDNPTKTGLHDIAELFLKVAFEHYCEIFQIYRGGQFYWWRKSVYPEKTTDLSQVIDKRYNLQSWVRTHAVLVIGLNELLDNPTT
jgi:hypothetical protein